MNLLNEIIDLLTTVDGSLGTALLRTKVLLYRIGQPELVEWVDAELTGYKDSKSVPNYRKIRGKVFGTISNGYYIHSNHQIPLGQLDEEERNALESSNEMHSIDIIEKMVSDIDKGSSYSSPIEPEICSALSVMFKDGYYIQNARTRFEISQFQQIVTQVRSRLLSFVLQLQDQIGDSMSDKDAKSAAAKIDVPTLFAGAVIGNNATFQIMGSHNQQSVQNFSSKGDMNALHNELRKAKVKDDDIAELDKAIAEDGDLLVIESGYGPKVKSWIGSMVGKALSGVWEVKLGVATGVLTNALSAYYGVAS